MVSIEKAKEIFKSSQSSEMVDDTLSLVIAELRLLIPINECKNIIHNVNLYSPVIEFCLPKLELVCKYANESNIHLLARCGVYYYEEEFAEWLYITQKNIIK